MPTSMWFHSSAVPVPRRAVRHTQLAGNFCPTVPTNQPHGYDRFVLTVHRVQCAPDVGRVALQDFHLNADLLQAVLHAVFDHAHGQRLGGVAGCRTMRHTVHSKAAQAVIFIFQRVTLPFKQLDCLRDSPVIFDDMLYRFAPHTQHLHCL